MTISQVSEIRNAIYRSESIEDLRLIDQAVRHRWREILSRKASLAKVQFGVGDKVRWTGRHGAQVGTILRFGPKNAIVRSEAGVEWRVTPTLLSKVS